jgi:AraC family transcriptional regulator
MSHHGGIMILSLNAYQHLQGLMTACSWRAGWRSLLLRAYDDPASVEELTTPPTADHLIVLVTEGSCDIEGLYRGRWCRAHYQTGSLGMAAPGEEVSLRWRSKSRHRNLQLHLPAAKIRTAIEEMTGRDANLVALPHTLINEDPLIKTVILTLADAMADGVPDLYAECAAHLLTAHLLTRHAKIAIRRGFKRKDVRLSRGEAFMRENLGAQLSLEEIARQAGLSRFHLLRLFKDAYGETPFKRLTRLRMEEAQRRLRHGAESLAEIAFSCGYENPAHFASAFRRLVGVSPSQYRRAIR